MSKHIILTESGGVASIETTSAPEYEAAEIPGWAGRSLEDSGVFFFMFKAEPDADEFPLHASEDEWLAIVLSGSGTLFSGSQSDDKLDSVDYVAGDFITFKANTQHGWKNGNKQSELLFVKRTG